MFWLCSRQSFLFSRLRRERGGEESVVVLLHYMEVTAVSNMVEDIKSVLHELSNL